MISGFRVGLGFVALRLQIFWGSGACSFRPNEGFWNIGILPYTRRMSGGNSETARWRCFVDSKRRIDYQHDVIVPLK